MINVLVLFIFYLFQCCLYELPGHPLISAIADRPTLAKDVVISTFIIIVIIEQVMKTFDSVNYLNM